MLQRDEYIRLRELVAEELARQGVSERQVSIDLEKDPAYLNKFLRGERTLEITELVDISMRLGLTPWDLLRRACG